MESSVASMITYPPLPDSFHKASKLLSIVNEFHRHRTGLTDKDLEGYNEQVKQSFSLTNASIPEITQARVQEIIKM